MTQSLTDFLKSAENKRCATDNGTRMHALMQRIVINKTGNQGDADIIKSIQKHPELERFFCAYAQTEVPIVGRVRGVFVSRRIDRLLIDNDTKVIDFIDYKTDVNKEEFIEKYKMQLKEYAELLCSAYPNYKINGYILWLHDWVLDKVV